MNFKPLLILLLLVRCLWADPTPEDPVTYRQENQSNGCVIYISNRLGNDMTVTLEFTEQNNVVGIPEFPYTMTIPGHSEVRMAEIRQSDPRQAWKYRYKYYWNFGSIQAHHDDSTVYTLPFAPGHSMRIVQGFHGAFTHHGDDEYAIDFSFAEGTPVLAAREGTVVWVEERYTQGGANEYFRNRVNVLRVRHADGTIGEYDHFRPNGIVVEEGDPVQRGQLLGYSGNTGFSSGAHLHFCVYGAEDGHHRHSYPIVFSVSGSSRPVELMQGQTYTAP